LQYIDIETFTFFSSWLTCLQNYANH